MEQMYITRLEHVCSRLTKMGLTQMIVSDPLSIRYLTGVWVDPYERLYALYLRTDGKHRFFLNNLFVVPDIDIPKTWFSDTDDGVAVIAGLVDGNVDMGIDKNWPARFLLALMEHHPNVRYVNASSCIDGERAIKDEYERQKMREASLLNDACIEKAAAHIKAGMTELECADYIRSLYKEAGCIESFSTIVSFGANAADPYLFLRNGRSRLRCDPRPRPQRQRKSGKPDSPWNAFLRSGQGGAGRDLRSRIRRIFHASSRTLHRHAGP